MTPKGLALMTVALCGLSLPQPAQAVAPIRCGAAPDFTPVLPRGTGLTYSDAIYSIGANSVYSLPKCGPVPTARKKAALLRVPPVPAPEPTILATAMPEPEIEVEVAKPEPRPPAPAPSPIQVAKPVPRPAVVAAIVPTPAPKPVIAAIPAPVPKPIEVQAQIPTQVPSEAESYSEPSMVAPVVIGLGTAAVLSYALWHSLEDKDSGKPARLSLSSEPVQALASYDTHMLASFAALNTVADLQSDQRVAMGVSSSVYDETSALAAGMSFRLGTQGIFKTAISYSDNEYLANAGLSYGW